MSNYLFDEKVPQLTFQKIKSPRPILALLQCTKTALLRANTQISESMRDKERCISWRVIEVLSSFRMNSCGCPHSMLQCNKTHYFFRLLASTPSMYHNTLRPGLFFESNWFVSGFQSISHKKKRNKNQSVQYTSIRSVTTCNVNLFSFILIYIHIGSHACFVATIHIISESKQFMDKSFALLISLNEHTYKSIK